MVDFISGYCRMIYQFFFTSMVQVQHCLRAWFWISPFKQYIRIKYNDKTVMTDNNMINLSLLHLDTMTNPKAINKNKYVISRTPIFKVRYRNIEKKQKKPKSCSHRNLDLICNTKVNINITTLNKIKEKNVSILL